MNDVVRIVAVMLAPIVLWLTSISVRRAADPRSARVGAGVGSAIAVTLAVAVACFGRTPDAPLVFDRVSTAIALDGLSAPLFVFTAAIVFAIALGSPARFAAPGTTARVLQTGALVLTALASRSSLVLALLWAASSIPMALELRSRPGHTIVVAHHALSAVLVATGAALWALHPAWTDAAGALAVLGVMVRGGILPFHTAVRRLYDGAPLSTALATMQAPLGAYVLARFVITGPLAPAPMLLDVLGIVTLLYAAMLSLVQTSARRVLAYLTIGQSALVLVGLADGGLLGASGAIAVAIASGVAHVGFGLTLWATEARRGSLQIDATHGRAGTPATAAAALVLGLSAVGLPGTLTFVGEDLIFHATLEARPWVGVAMIVAAAVNAISVLRVVLRLFGGAQAEASAIDLTGRERVVLGALVAVLFVLGALPSPVLTSTEAAFDHLGLHAPAGQASGVAIADVNGRNTSNRLPRPGTLDTPTQPR